MTTDTAPGGLGPGGAALWGAVLADYELRADELPVLAAACRLADDEARLTEALADAPAVSVGARGALRVNPLFHETRQTRLALSRVLASLGLGDVARDGSEKSHAGRRLARLRWSGRIVNG